MYKEYDEWWNELWEISNKIRPYYNIDKVKGYSVYIWSICENEDDEENIFDIYADDIQFWTDNHFIIPEAMPIIKEIQDKLKEGQKWYGIKG